jgi:ribosomal protein S18 acetylase RimI-like enzyme
MVSIREANAADLAQIVSAHERCFPGFLMTMLGSAFLGAYYRTSFDYAGTVALVAQEGGDTVGFVVGYVAPQKFYALLRKRRWRLASSAIRAVLRSPSSFPRVFGNMQRMSGAARPSTTSRLGTELAAIGVIPEASRKGLGKALVRNFVQRAGALKAEYVHLTTDAENNDEVNVFYQKLGFARSKAFAAPGGRLLNEYVLFLEGRSG